MIDIESLDQNQTYETNEFSRPTRRAAVAVLGGLALSAGGFIGMVANQITERAVPELVPYATLYGGLSVTAVSFAVLQSRLKRESENSQNE